MGSSEGTGLTGCCWLWTVQSLGCKACSLCVVDSSPALPPAEAPCSLAHSILPSPPSQGIRDSGSALPVAAVTITTHSEANGNVFLLGLGAEV